MANLGEKPFLRVLAVALIIVVFLILQIVILIIVSKTHSVGVNNTNSKSPLRKSPINVKKDFFGRLAGGTPVDRYTITNEGGMTVQVITYGSTITSIKTPDKRNYPEEITLGFDNIQGYEQDRERIGALIGRVARSIDNGRFVYNNVSYQLTQNGGRHHFHGGTRGWNKLMWEAEAIEDGVVMSLESEDGDEGYPGKVTATVTYQLTGDNELIIRFQAKTAKKDTPINLTTHPYFNLAGEGTGSINDHNITIFADYYLITRSDLIPTGQTAEVKNTLMDLRKSNRLGEVLPKFNGYDQTYILRGPTGKKLAARAYHPESGRMLEVYTNQPSIQFYTGNYLTATIRGREGHSYPKHSGFCLQTMNYPDAVNHKEFPDSILRIGSTYDHWAWYKFSVVNT